MIVSNLAQTSVEEIIDCLLLAFENYYVKMPTDYESYKRRWRASKVNFDLSYGMFDQGRLVGFIINAVDRRNGCYTAFNTGTGVIPDYRGQGIVNSIYEQAFDDFRQMGIQKCTLEVITINEPAIRSYQRVGFEVCKNYNCYGGEIVLPFTPAFALSEIPLDQVNWNSLPDQQFYSWDFQSETIKDGDYVFYQVMYEEEPESFFIFKHDTKTIGQMDILKNTPDAWTRLFAAIQSLSISARIINVDDRLSDKIDAIKKYGLKNTVNQYEMELSVD